MERRGLSDRAALAAAAGRGNVPMRSEVLVRCGERAWSTPELAEDLGCEQTLAGYHVRTLVTAGLLWEETRETRHGAPLVYYRADSGWAAAFAALNALAERSGA